MYIPNALDEKIYREIVRVEDRPEYSISVLYHESEHKGFKYSFQVIEKLRVKYPKLHVDVWNSSETEMVTGVCSLQTKSNTAGNG